MNLTKTAILFKRWVKIAILVLGVYYGWMFIGGPGLKSLYGMIVKTRDPANPIYGNLDPLEFIAKEVSGDQVYKLNTKNGRLPGKLPYKLPVYKFKAQPFSFVAGNDAIEDAEMLGYEQQHLITDLKGSTYKWRRADTSSYLEIDINSRRIIGDSDMVRNSARMGAGNLGKEEDIRKRAADFFDRLGRIDDSYKNGVQKITFGYIGGTKLYQTTAQRDVVFARVDLYRKISDFLVLGPDSETGVLYVYVASPRTESTMPIVFPKFSAFFREVETRTDASYPIIDVSTAWEAVKNGKGVITSVVPAGSSIFDKQTVPVVSEILVDNIYLAYYENTKNQTHLQPIYVFEAKYKSLGSQGGELTIYLPAVSGEYVKPVAPAAPAATQ